MKSLFYLSLLFIITSCSVFKRKNIINTEITVIQDTINYNSYSDGDEVPNFIDDTLVFNVEKIVVESFVLLDEPENSRNQIQSEKIIPKPKLVSLIELKNENVNIIDKTVEDTTSSKGTIAYSVPNDMIVGNKYPIKVRITKNKGDEVNKTLVLGDREIPINDVSHNSNITIENIRVERTMTTQLLSEDGTFEISKMNTDNQIIEDDGYTEWGWVVVPLKSGTSYLKMVIKIKIVSGDETHYKDIVVFDKNIQVKANISLGVKSWISLYWQWVITTIITPLIIFLYKRKKSKKSQI